MQLKAVPKLGCIRTAGTHQIRIRVLVPDVQAQRLLGLGQLSTSRTDEFIRGYVISRVALLDVLSQSLDVRARLPALFTGCGWCVVLLAVSRKLLVGLKAAKTTIHYK